jgi:hypothetical protein
MWWLWLGSSPCHINWFGEKLDQKPLSYNLEKKEYDILA